jgi:DNA-binding NarL/FixJ family response regulator
MDMDIMPSEKDEKIKILLVDDQALITDSLRTYLSNYAEDMEVVGVAENGKDAVAQAEKYIPDIILMDVRMPVLNGIDALKTIKKKYPKIKILMLSTYDEDEYVRSALLEGAAGYLLKAISPTELITALRALKNNVIQISPDIARRMVEQKYNGTDPQKKATVEFANAEEPLDWIKTLTRREREIFTLLATGYDNEQIAEKLFIAPQTVKNHVSVIYSKLGVKDRFEIIRLANQR